MNEDETRDDAFATAQYRAMAQATSDAIVTIDANSTVRFANQAVEELFGYRPEEIRGRSMTVLMSDEQADRHREGVERYLRTGERRLDWSYVELEGRHRDGSTVPLGVSFAEFVHDDERLFTGIVRDISVRKSFERKLTALTELSRTLADQPTAAAVCERVLAVTGVFFDGRPAAIALYDDDAGELAVEATSPEFDAAAASFDDLVDLGWDAFAMDEPLQVAADDGNGPAVLRDAPFDHVRVQPTGRYGVLFILTPAGEAGELSPVDEEVADLLADRIETAFDRLDRQRTLERRNAQLEQRNEALQWVNALNDVIRRLTGGLISAATREEIQERVVRELAASELFEFAWFGEPDPVDGVFVRRASSGGGRGYLDEVTFPTDAEGDDPSPTERAATTREVHVESDLHVAPPFERWRDAALQRGFRAAAAIPVGRGDAFYGVLTLYASEPAVFETMERAVLAELGAMVGYAIHAVQRRRALVDEGSVELEYRVADADLDLIRFVRETGATFEFETVLSDGDGSLRMFFTVEGADPGETRAFAERAASVERVRAITEDPDDDEYLYEAWITEAGPIGTILELGAVPREITASGDEAWFTVELPRSADVREFVAALDRRYDEVDLAARRERDRPIQTEGEFRARLEERLTAKQMRILEAAYWNGYFDWPRKQTGEEIAASLGISQPTLNRHLRAGERKLLELVLEEAGG